MPAPPGLPEPGPYWPGHTEGKGAVVWQRMAADQGTLDRQFCARHRSPAGQPLTYLSAALGTASIGSERGTERQIRTTPLARVRRN